MRSMPSRLTPVLGLLLLGATLVGCSHWPEVAPHDSTSAPPASAAAPPTSFEPQWVQLPSGDATTPMLPAWWWPVSSAQPSPLVVLLHGCGGMFSGSERGEQRVGSERALSTRFKHYAALLHAQGWQVLIVDSLTPRGERELCTQRLSQRRVHQGHRRADALAALRWAAQQPGVDPQRLALMGWSHGGSAVLSSLNARYPEVRQSPVRPAAAVAYYPGCEAERQRGFEPSAPLWLMLGADDDWTAPEPCVALAREAQGPHAVQAQLFEGAVHGFDSTAPVRLRRDVPNGTRPGQGVHVGGQPAALAASEALLLQVLRNALAVPGTASH
ncbi:dienelactone hydrolase family protein [Ideonella paludis]|nr:dienelactone hydrolase family protein [Ideonella paludis]